MIERTINSDSPPGPLDGCSHRVNCEFVAQSTEERASRMTSNQRRQYFRCCIRDRHCPLTGLSCDRRPAASQVDPAAVQGAELTRPEPGDQQEFQRDPDVRGTGRSDPLSLIQRDGPTPLHTRLANPGDGVGVDVPLSLPPCNHELDDRQGGVSRGLSPRLPGHPLAEVVGLEPRDLKGTAHRYERPDPAAVGLHGGELEPPRTVGKPELGETSNGDPAGRVGASPHGEPRELGVSFPFRTTQEYLAAVKRGVPRLSGATKPGSGDTSAGHGRVLS